MEKSAGRITHTILATLYLLGLTQSFCLYRGPDCMPSGDPTCQTILRNYSDPADVQPSSEPVPDEYKGVCPDFENGPRCCDTNTLKILKFNFNNLLDPTFGSPDGGCSICSANLKRFWCHYNCAPSQNQNHKKMLPTDKFIQSERFHSTSLNFPIQLHSESDRPLFMATDHPVGRVCGYQQHLPDLRVLQECGVRRIPRFDVFVPGFVQRVRSKRGDSGKCADELQICHSRGSTERFGQQLLAGLRIGL